MPSAVSRNNERANDGGESMVARVDVVIAHGRHRCQNLSMRTLLLIRKSVAHALLGEQVARLGRIEL